MATDFGKMKNAEYMRRYRKSHPEYVQKKNDYFRNRYNEDEEFREKHREYCHRYYLEHKDQIKKKEKEWYQAHRDHALQKSREQYQRKKAEKGGQ